MGQVMNMITKQHVCKNVLYTCKTTTSPSGHVVIVSEPSHTAGSDFYIIPYFPEYKLHPQNMDAEHLNSVVN